MHISQLPIVRDRSWSYVGCHGAAHEATIVCGRDVQTSTLSAQLLGVEIARAWSSDETCRV